MGFLSLKEVDAVVGLLKINSKKKKDLSFIEKTRKNVLQRKVLKTIYHLTNFPSTEVREELALLLGITSRSVQVWFQNRRQKNKKAGIMVSHAHSGMCHSSICEILFPHGHKGEEVILDSGALISIIIQCYWDVYGSNILEYW